MSQAKTRWSESGYVLSTRYERHFIAEQDPTRLSYAAISNHQSAPDPRLPFRYLDIGCGEGVTLNCLAAAYPHASFVGIDFNPEHIRSATRLAKDAGLNNIKFLHISFDAYQAENIDKFEYVAAHGIISWVEADDAQKTFDLASKFTADDGLFYLCYYTRPGALWTDITHRLVNSTLSDAPGINLEEKINARLDAIERLADAKQAPLFSMGDAFQKTVASYKESEVHFNLHELGNKNLTSYFFGDVASNLLTRGFCYSASSDLPKNNLCNWIHPSVLASVSGQSPNAQQELASLMAFESFRWDIFQRKATTTRRLSTHLYNYDEFFLFSLRTPYRFPDKIKLIARTVVFDEPIYRAILELAKDGQKTVKQLIDEVSLAGHPKDLVRSHIEDLISGGLFKVLPFKPVVPESSGSFRYHLTSKLPSVLFERDFDESGLTYVSAPSVGLISHANGFDAIATILIDGLTFAEAKVAIKAKISEISKESIERYHLQEYISEDGFEKAISGYRLGVLPKLIKLGIIEQEVEGSMF